MKVPFQLRIGEKEKIQVELAEIEHYRTAKRNEDGIFTDESDEKGGATYVSYYIKNKFNDKGRIYTGFAICSYSDKFGRKYGRRVAELRLINKYRRRNKMPCFSNEELQDIIDYEYQLKIDRGHLNKLIPTEFNQQKIHNLAYKVDSQEQALEAIWRDK